MKILDRYIFKQVFLATLLAVFIVLIVWVSPEILFKIIRKAVAGDITYLAALKLFFWELPEILGKTIPIALMLASLFIFDRLSRDSEILVIKGIGINFLRLLAPVVVIGFIGASTCFYTNEVLVPQSTAALKVMKNDIDSDHFVYVDKTSAGKPQLVTIIGNYDGKNVTDIKFLGFSSETDFGAPELTQIINADKAQWAGDHWTIFKGTMYDIDADGVYKKITHFNTAQMPVPSSHNLVNKLLSYSLKKPKNLSISQIHDYSKLLAKADMQEELRFMRTKYHQRFAQSFACILFVLCGSILGFSKPREKRLMGFTLGVALVFAYYIILPFLDMVAQMGIIFPIVAAWIPNFIILGAALFAAKMKDI